MNIREIRDSDEMLWVIGVIDIPNLCHVFEIRVKIPSRIAMFLSLLNFFFFFFIQSTVFYFHREKRLDRRELCLPRYFKRAQGGQEEGRKKNTRQQKRTIYSVDLLAIGISRANTPRGSLAG